MGYLVVFDMEWNMGYRPKNFRYHGVEQVLRGEIIQIGAVKMEGQEIRDTFRVTLRPTIFRKLHHQVAKITGLTQKSIDAGKPIAQGLREFREWCGEDAVLGEWGADDVPVLKQNLFLVGQDESWPVRWCDLQRVYSAQRPPQEGEGMSLESVVERLGIEKDQAFHDALSDALYTAKVMQHVDIQKGLESYPDDVTQLRELLCPADKRRCDFTSWGGIPDGEAWRKRAKLRSAVCPDCGSPLTPDSNDLWLKQGNNCLYSMGTCREHGPAMVWIRRSHSDGLHYLFGRATEKADMETQKRWEREKRSALRHMSRKQAADSAPQSGSGKPNRSSRPPRHQ